MEVAATKADKARRQQRSALAVSAFDVARRRFAAAGSDDKAFVQHIGNHGNHDLLIDELSAVRHTLYRLAMPPHHHHH